MKPHESILITGVKRYSNYSGYAMSLKFGGSYEDKQPLDAFDRIKRTFTAIDACYLCGDEEQYQQFHPKMLLRELNKATIGFEGDHQESDVYDHRIAVTTGNWG
jgi:poly(ADP-ribose) glycohydrolase